MDYTKEIFPLNNFVLLSKGWLKLKGGKGRKSLEAIASALNLDDYGFVKTWDDVIRIVSRHFDKYNQWRKSMGLSYWDLCRLLHSVSEMENYDRILSKDPKPSGDSIEKRFVVYAFMDYFAFNCGKGEIVLSPNHFSSFNTGQKRLFDKKGKFVISFYKVGMSYKEMNDIITKRLMNDRIAKEFKID